MTYVWIHIYKITNKANGKVYVGKTTDTVQVRWKEHLKDFKRKRCANRPLYRAIRKYGIDAFNVETIEEADLDVLSERETYWIEYFNTYSDGYNATSGGDGKVLYDYDLIAKLLREGRKHKEVMNIVGCCSDTVTFVSKKYHIDYIPERNRIPVEQYDLEGHYIQSFSSYREASRWIIENNYTSDTSCRGVRSHILKVANGKQKHAYGFIWKKV